MNPNPAYILESTPRLADTLNNFVHFPSILPVCQNLEHLISTSSPGQLSSGEEKYAITLINDYKYITFNFN